MTITEQTGVQRMGKSALHTWDTLAQVKEYKFDLYDADFREYHASRRGTSLEQDPLGRITLTSMSDTQIVHGPEHAESIKGHVYTIEERIAFLGFVKRLRASLTDTYELYLAQRDA